MRVLYDIDYEAIARHVRAQFAQARVCEEPCPHMQLDNLLPDDYYDLLLDALPIPQDVGSDNSGALNFAMVETDPNFSRMTSARKQLWTDFDKCVSQSVIRQEMTRLFSRYVALKFEMMLDPAWPQRAESVLGPNWREALASGDIYQPEGGSGGRLLLVTKNFHLVPHVDNANSILTYLIYMPRDNSREHLGTKMHVVADKKAVCQKYRSRKNTDVWFAEKKDLTPRESVFPFRRNSVIAMLCVPTAVHSIECKDINYCRYLMQTQIGFRDDLSNALFEGWSAKGVGYS
jgi:hypothetical protein